jgi:hypothetical protein
MDTAAYRARAERRRDRRHGAHIDAVLAWDGISQHVTIRNLSIYGALIHGAYLPTIGERATVIADHLEVWGTVIWRGADLCGLLLTGPIDPAAVIRDHPVQSLPTPFQPILSIETAHMSS